MDFKIRKLFFDSQFDRRELSRLALRIVVIARQETRGKSKEFFRDFTFLYTVWFYCVHLLTIIFSPKKINKYNYQKVLTDLKLDLSRQLQPLNLSVQMAQDNYHIW
jgi:hypothetical protein